MHFNFIFFIIYPTSDCSRNTEHKQWSETQVLTISGVARVFVTKRSLLHSLGDFPKAWRLLLEHVEKLALSPTQEVSIAKLNLLPLFS